MTRPIEYLERRCAINEEVLNTLGEILGANLPACRNHLVRIGEAWDDAIDKLNRDFPLEDVK